MPELQTQNIPSQDAPQQEDKRIHLESVERISNLPVISTGINFTTGLYSKVKESNGAFRFILESAEHTVNKATQLAEPVTNILEKPLKIGDSAICKSMDFVGSSIPKVVETPQKLYSKAVSSVPVQPAVDCVKTVGSYGVQKVNHLYSQLQKTEKSEPQEDETEKETEPEKHEQGTQTLAGNVRNKAKIFSQ